MLKSSTDMIIRRLFKLTLAMLACVALVWLTLGVRAGGAQEVEGGGQRELSPQEKHGQQIYLKGESFDGASDIRAFLGSDKLEVLATSFACSDCHGLGGEGTREGGLQPPPINWKTLNTSHTSLLTRRERPPYMEATLARAIKLGLDPKGASLHPGMPQYDLKPEQMADLIAYLKKLGKDSNSGPVLDDKRAPTTQSKPSSK